MALLNSELQRVRYELGYNVLSAGAEPYVDYVAIFDVVIQRYLNAGAKTTSTTYLAELESPAIQGVVLTSATGFSAGDRIWLDVDNRQESGIVEEVAGSTVKLLLRGTHGVLAGTSAYPVTVDGGEAIIRDILANIKAVQRNMSLAGSDAQDAATLAAGGGLKRVDEIEFYPSGPFGAGNGNANTTGGAMFANLNAQLRFWRNELATALNVQNLRELNPSGGNCSIALY